MVSFYVGATAQPSWRAEWNDGIGGTIVFEVFAVGAAFIFGLAARPLGLPPLVGFLAAGFFINAVGPKVGMPATTGPILEYLANLGVLLLLFTVGLKLKLKQIGEPHVVGGAVLHFALSIVIFTPVTRLLFTDDWTVALLVGIALAFSSTVLAAKMLEAKREMGNFHGRAAIGILIVQDIIALVVLAVFSGKVPGPWALLIFATPLLRPVLYKLLDLAGHDEILVLAGMALSLVIGGYGFEIIGLKGEIGALVMGLLLSNAPPRQASFPKSLWSLKEVFLDRVLSVDRHVGFAGLGFGDLRGRSRRPSYRLKGAACSSLLLVALPAPRANIVPRRRSRSPPIASSA